MTKKYKFNIGDRLYVTKSIIITHFGIYVGNGMIIDNSDIEKSVQLRTVEVFAAGREIRVSHVANPKYTPEEVVSRARAMIGKPYKMVSQNCEHFVNEIQLDIPKSTQAAVAGGILLYIGYKLLTSK